MSALRKEFFDNPESDFEFPTLRLVLFFELRRLHHKGVAEDKDYERLNRILRKIRSNNGYNRWKSGPGNLIARFFKIGLAFRSFLREKMTRPGMFI